MTFIEHTSYEEFSRLASQGNVVPVTATVLADTVTPVAAFMKVAAQHERAFLLESVEGGEKLARFSFLGVAPRLHLRYSRPALHIISEEHEETREQSLFEYMQQARRQWQPVTVPGLPRFTGGFVGYFSYDLVRDLEQLPESHNGDDDNAVPDAELSLYDTVLAFDHLRQQIVLIANVLLKTGELNVRRRYDEALAKLEHLQALLAQPLPETTPPKLQQPADPVYHTTREDFINKVEVAKDYIRAGDIFQVVLSQRFHSAITVEPLQIYRALRLLNPSPYLYFLKNGDDCLIGSSPEVLVRVENGNALVRPIAGTRRRGASEAEDQALAAELRADAKECAEHLMLVDLGRNDLGRVCDYGSVQVNELMIIERYSHVMHLVSNVQGQLRPSLDALDALRACFPAGTVSGAPKIRAMEIIDELEAVRRGPYAGAVGYLDFSGNLDTCITIRTIWTHGDHAYFQAGAGIVADSIPEKEFLETIDKSRALWSAIELAERGL